VDTILLRSGRADKMRSPDAYNEFEKPGRHVVDPIELEYKVEMLCEEEAARIEDAKED
jgi:hypothetical protein